MGASGDTPELPATFDSLLEFDMCGIAGIVAWDDRHRVNREVLGRMSARIAHRGPDGEGTFLNHEGEARPDRPQAGLVHRRLAIIDPDPRANQPFGDAAGRQLVFNGEIYNYRELRSELKSLRPDYAWRTESDTEVLLLAYAVWGEKCVERLNGMFAFAVWDERAGSLFLARDRMGQKPLYVAYLQRDGRAPSSLDYHFEPEAPAVIAFASELAALRDLAWIDRSIDDGHLVMYLSIGYILHGTIYRGVRQLKPGDWLRAKGSGCGQDRYLAWEVPRPIESRRAVAETGRLVREAVSRQLVADVPVGCFLSGGIDSSIVAAAAKVSGADVQTFSIGFDDARYDETRYADAVARHLRTRHRSFTVKPNATAELAQLAVAFGEPFGDSSALPTYYLSRETRNHVKVALSGDGGDELFGGYDRYRAMRVTERIRRLPFPLPDLIGADAWQRLPGSHPKSRAARIKRLTASVRLPADRRYASFVRLFQGPLLHALLPMTTRPPFEREPEGIVDTYGAYHHKWDAVRTALFVDQLTYLPGDLLTKIDRASMLHALEVRSPFMDHELVTFAAGLTTDQLLRGGPKRMLREAFAADLPAWVFKRKKMGFAVPIGEWFRDRRGPVRAMLHDHLFAADAFGATHFQMATVRRLVDEHESGKVDHAQRLYALLMLELWWKSQRHP